MSGYEPPKTYDLPDLGVVGRDRAVAICRAVADQNVSHRQAWEAEQRAAGRIWTAIYWRHRQQYEEEEFSLEEAKQTLIYGSDAGEMAPMGVKLPDGSMLDYSYDWNVD